MNKYLIWSDFISIFSIFRESPRQSGSFSVDAGDESDKTPLHYAALNGADEVFQLLVENKADIDALDAVGATPLHFAVR